MKANRLIGEKSPYLLHLYRSTFDVAWAERAAALQAVMLEELWDEKGGGFFLCGLDFALRPGQEMVDPILGKTDAPR